ncbi:MAG: DUF4258 domain-containing protein [Phycisphaeraceae bacterium]
MGALFDRILTAVNEERYIFSDHTDNILRERGIMHWQVVQGLEDARVLSERPGTKPNPAVEVEQSLADGTNVKAVWAYVKSVELAKLVTVHFFDR